ncbi:MAG: sigma-54-dependent transcriptional regulator [Spirochaetia bacterium]
MYRIVYIDDDQSAFQSLSAALPNHFHLIHAASGSEGLTFVQSKDPHLVILEIDIQDLDGLVLLQKMQELPCAPPILILTNNKDSKTIVRAIKEGAYNYLIKPSNPKNIVKSIDEIMTSNTKVSRVETVISDYPELDKIAGESPAIQDVKEKIVAYANTDAPIFISGESGTGKDLVAQSIHDISQRKAGPYIPQNCSTIPESLFESELFGCVKGAFTGAENRKGAFECAHKGSIFLDEIAELPLYGQVKLLRVLEDKMVQPIGSTKRKKIDIRIISATNRNLKRMIAAKAFREELYYRIHILPIYIPPLRQRTIDIPIITERIMKTSFNGKSISYRGMKKLTSHHWPGNVRELFATLHRAAILTKEDRIEDSDIIF